MKNLLLFFLFILSTSLCVVGQKTEELLSKAQAGDKEAQYDYANKLTQLWPKESDYQKAIIWLQKSAEQGYVHAQVKLGYWYGQGYGVKKDPEKAFYWYKKAADQGNATAQYDVGICYENGKGVKESKTDALYWYKKAAEQDYENALFALGDCYYHGKGTSVDNQLAYDWFMKAANKGHSGAMAHLGDIFYYGYGKTKDHSKALEWYEKASDTNEPSPSAEYNLALMYLKGESVKKDSVYAADLLLQSAGGGYFTPEHWSYESKKANKDAETKLIELCSIEQSPSCHYFLALTGCWFAAKQEYQKAEQYFKKSIDKQSALGIIHLGLMYFYICVNTPQLNPSYDLGFGSSELELESWKYSDNSRCVEYANHKSWTDNDNVAYWLEQAIDYGFGSYDYGPMGYSLYDYLLYVYVGEVGGKKDLNKAIDVAYKCLLDTTVEHNYNNPGLTLEIARDKPELANKLYTTFSNLYNDFKKMGIVDEDKIGLASEGLGRCYYNGSGVGKSYEKAFNYFTIADQNGNNYATCELGEMYYNGDYKKRDYSKAFSLFDKASELEHYMTINSMIMLSSCYRYGYGTSKDLQKAEYWLKKAQEAGDETLNRINQIKGNKN